MLQEAVDDYIAVLAAKKYAGGSNRNTITAYRNDLYQLCSYLTLQGVEGWQAVDHEHIAAYLREMRDGLAYRPTTIARKVAAFKSFFRYMLDTRKELSVSPIENQDTPRVQKDLPHALSVEQVNCLFNRVHTDTELVSLNLADFNAARATVLCPGRNGQKKRERLLPLPIVAVEAVQRYLEEARPRLVRRESEQALFLNHHGEHLTRQGFWLIIKGYAREAGIADITPHVLRHSFAILMLKEGMELRSVQELLGHAHISTTQVYSQLVCAKQPDQ